MVANASSTTTKGQSRLEKSRTQRINRSKHKKREKASKRVRRERDIPYILLIEKSKVFLGRIVLQAQAVVVDTTYGSGNHHGSLYAQKYHGDGRRRYVVTRS